MLKLPKECVVNKFIPKKVFYEKVGVSSSVKNDFINQVERITWLYKLSPDTIGLSKTENVEEIEIFQIDLKDKIIPKNIIKAITKGIPYKILFVLKYKDDTCYSIKVEDIYTTEWNKNIELDFNVINLDLLYEKIVKIIIDEKNNNRNFEEIIEEKNIINNLEKKINNLKVKIKNEKQFNKKALLNEELNCLLKEMEDLK